MAEKRKAPKGCYWRGSSLWGRITVQGREIRFSLRTDDAKVAEGRLKARRDREVAAAHFGDARPT
jgi:integrase/recombinase XerD